MKKTFLIIWAALAFAVVPATALAVNSPELTYPTGTKLASESAIRATNVGEVKLTSAANTLACSSASLKGTLKKNSGTEIEADIESASFNNGGECSGTEPGSINTTPSKNGTPWCLRSTAELLDDEFQVRGGKCSEASRPIRLVTRTTRSITSECVFERSGAIVGTYKTHPEDALLTSNEVEYTKVSGAITCPATTKLDTSLTFERDEGETNPLYLSAGPLATFPTGTALAVNSKVRARNVGTITMTTGLGNQTCSAAELTGTLKKNSGTEIEADIESFAFSGTGTEKTCTSTSGNLRWTFGSATNGLPWCLRATSKMAADEFQIRGNGCASASRPIRISYEWTNVLATECTYERAAALAGTFTTHPADAALTFTNSTFVEAEPKSGSCPDETQLDGSMTLEREEAGTHPMYIS